MLRFLSQLLAEVDQWEADNSSHSHSSNARVEQYVWDLSEYQQMLRAFLS